MKDRILVLVFVFVFVGSLVLGLLIFGVLLKANEGPRPALRKVRLETAEGIKDVRARVWETDKGLLIQWEAEPPGEPLKDRNRDQKNE